MEGLEHKIRNFLLNEEKKEIVSEGIKISIKQDGNVELTELPSTNLEQLELPLTTKSE
jgi:hypothetical protein